MLTQNVRFFSSHFCFVHFISNHDHIFLQFRFFMYMWLSILLPNFNINFIFYIHINYELTTIDYWDYFRSFQFGKTVTFFCKWKLILFIICIVCLLLCCCFFFVSFCKFHLVLWIYFQWVCKFFFDRIHVRNWFDYHLMWRCSSARVPLTVIR